MGVLARRFLNLIVPGRTPGVNSLRRINLARQQLFYHDAPPPSSNALASTRRAATEIGATSRPSSSSKMDMEILRLPRPSLTFRALNNEWKMDCFPLADCKVICGDQSGHGFVVDLDSRTLETMPPLRKPMAMPVSVFVHKPDVDDDSHSHGYGSSLFLMERIPQREPLVQETSEQFVGFVHRYPRLNRGGKSWQCHLLPPPPFVLETCNCCNSNLKITAYGAVGGGGSHVCVSVEGVGTYCLDTASHMWSRVGEWTLPFHGRVEYVPELKLWFGLSADGQHLAAADLSDMDSQSQPQLLGGPWKELDPPEGWKECKDPQFVSLGSGRFCIARFFREAQQGCGDEVAVFTGVEISSSGRGEGSARKLELRMTPHKSRRVNNGSIETLF